MAHNGRQLFITTPRGAGNVVVSGTNQDNEWSTWEGQPGPHESVLTKDWWFKGDVVIQYTVNSTRFTEIVSVPSSGGVFFPIVLNPREDANSNPPWIGRPESILLKTLEHLDDLKAKKTSASNESSDSTQANQSSVSVKVKEVISEQLGVDVEKIGLDNSIFLGENRNIHLPSLSFFEMIKKSKRELSEIGCWLPDNDFGMDKLDALELLFALNDEFNLEISDDEVEGVRTVQWVVDLILTKKKY